MVKTASPLIRSIIFPAAAKRETPPFSSIPYASGTRLPNPIPTPSIIPPVSNTRFLKPVPIGGAFPSERIRDDRRLKK
jgi:hypothetical protein